MIMSMWKYFLEFSAYWSILAIRFKFYFILMIYTGFVVIIASVLSLLRFKLEVYVQNENTFLQLMTWAIFMYYVFDAYLGI